MPPLTPPFLPGFIPPGPAEELPPVPSALPPVPGVGGSFPQPQMPEQPIWQRLMPVMFALGAKVGGAPMSGAGALAGAEEGRQQQMAEAQRQQQMLMQQAAVERQMAAQAAMAEERRQAAIKAAVDDLRLQKFTKKADYDQAVTFRENLLMQAYGVRPHTLRMLVPYNGPTFETDAADAVNEMIKRHGPEVLTSGYMIAIDRDGDGVKENIPILDAAKIGKVPFLQGPDGKPMIPPKEVKASEIQEFDIAYKGVLAEWQAEGKNVNDPVVQGKAATEARNRLTKASRQATASIIMPPPPEKPLTRFQRYTAERGLRTDAEKAAAPVRELFRQVDTMRAGLQQARSGRRTAGVQAVINSFNRILEPGSVTREAEYLRTSAGQPLLDALRGKVEAITAGGQGVTIQTLEDAVALAEQIAQNMANYADEQFGMIGAQADEYQIPRERVIPNLSRSGSPSPRATTAPPISASSNVGDAVTLPDGRVVEITEKNRTGFKYRVVR